MRSFKSNENIRKKEDGSYYVVSTIKAPSTSVFNTSLGTLQMLIHRKQSLIPIL